MKVMAATGSESRPHSKISAGKSEHGPPYSVSLEAVSIAVVTRQQSRSLVIRVTSADLTPALASTSRLQALQLSQVNRNTPG